MIGDLVAAGTDLKAAKSASYPSQAAFQRCLAAGGIQKPMREVRRMHVDSKTGLGHFILECEHAMPFSSASKVRARRDQGVVRTAEGGRRFKRPCAHCARLRFERGDPAIAVEYADWARRQYEAQLSSDLIRHEPQRRLAADTALRRFKMATDAALRRLSRLAIEGSPALPPPAAA